MAECHYCGSGTDLYHGNVPICLACAESAKATQEKLCGAKVVTGLATLMPWKIRLRH